MAPPRSASASSFVPPASPSPRPSSTTTTMSTCPCATNGTHPSPSPPSLSLPTTTTTSTTSASSHPTEFVILGSGVSTALPRISCIIRPLETRDRTPCPVCHDALHTPASPNRRCNVSALVRHAGRTLLLDCGKTMREAALRHFPTLGVEAVDAIVLTHGHADAMQGLDDMRDIQRYDYRHPERNKATPVYLNDDTFAVCKRAFPYLVPVHNDDDDDNNNSMRRVSSIDWRVFQPHQYFHKLDLSDCIDNVDITPIPLLHGGDYICMGFIIQYHTSSSSSSSPFVVAYLSDLHDIPQQTMDYLRNEVRNIDLLVIDLLANRPHFSHLCKQQVIDFVRVLRPRRAVTVGMTCSLGLHDDVNKELQALREEGIDLSLAHDGQRFPVK